MKLHALLFLGIAVLSSMACTEGGNTTTPASDLDASAVRAAIDVVRIQYMAASMASDAARVAGLYSEDAIVLYPNRAAIVGQPEILEYFTAFFGEVTLDRFQLNSDEIQIAGAWAFDRGTYDLRVVPRAGGEPIEDHGKYLVILQRQVDGSWKVARDMDNSDGPPMQAPRT